MSERFPGGGGGGDQQVVVEVGGGGGGGGGVFPFYHVPQQSRREKLRYPNADEQQQPPAAAAPPSSSLLSSPQPLPSSLYIHNPSLFIGPSSSSLSLPPPSSSMLNPSYSATEFDQATSTTTTSAAAAGFLQRHFFPHQAAGMSLSLSSHHHHHHPFNPPSIDPRASLGSGGGMSRAPAPSEPFTGYAAVLKGSRFLRPAQQMLEELCDVGFGRGSALVCGDDTAELALDGPGESGGVSAADVPMGSGGEQRRMKTRLISMLDEVYRRYKQYYQQIQVVVTSFESVAGLSNAAPYTSLALKSMAKHFRCLKDAISDQLRFTDKALGKEGHSKDEMPGFGLINSSLCYQGGAHSSGGIGQPNVWRPQRGLPERAVAVLKAWLFEHFLHPYPTDTDKHMLAKQTGLSRNQVSNWFINARVRLWKPLVEEIHSLEMRQARKVPEADNSNNNHDDTNRQSHLPPASSELHSSKQPMQSVSTTEKNQDPPLKRFRNEFAEMPNHIEEPLNFCFDDFPGHHRLGMAGIAVPGGGNAGISLTLGLHQNNGLCIQEPLPLNVARRFGLDEGSGSYVMGGFEVQDRHFGKDIDGQLLRDFVG